MAIPKINHPILRETAAKEEETPVLILLSPPGNTITFRPKNSRQGYSISMQRAYELSKIEGTTAEPKKIQKTKTVMTAKYSMEERLTKALEKLTNQLNSLRHSA